MTAKAYFETYFHLTNTTCPIEVVEGLPWSKQECLAVLDDMVDACIELWTDSSFELAALAHNTTIALRRQ